MIQIRDVLQAKFGSIDQAVALFTNPPAPLPGIARSARHFEVLTDVSGRMFTLVSQLVVQDLGEFETLRDKDFQDPDFDKWFRQFQICIEGGRREYYNIEGNFESWSGPGSVAVRETYQAYKWQIRNAVSLLQRYGALLVNRGVGQKPRILTDASGPMFQAVIEIETESVSAWESQRRMLFREVEFQVWFNQMITTVEFGTHEFYRVEYTSG
jgi:hypothetical protein